MSGNQIITISVPENSIDAVKNLAGDYPEAVTLGRFRPMTDLGAPSTFPVIDPTVIEFFQQVTIVVVTGTATVEFLKKLHELVASVRGKITTQDDKSKEKNT